MKLQRKYFSDLEEAQRTARSRAKAFWSVMYILQDEQGYFITKHRKAEAEYVGQVERDGRWIDANAGDPVLEKLAGLAHAQWSGWMEYLFEKCTENEDGTATMPAWAVERWKRQLATPYTKLSEQEKESDRVEARKVFEVLKEMKVQQ
jgi:hypothetical protein